MSVVDEELLLILRKSRQTPVINFGRCYDYQFVIASTTDYDHGCIMGFSWHPRAKVPQHFTRCNIRILPVATER